MNLNKAKEVKEPEFLKLIAWFLIIVSGYILLSQLRPQSSNLAAGITQLSSGTQDIFPVLYGILSVVIWFAFYITLLVSSINLLGLNLWALETVEILTWIYLFYTFLVFTLVLFSVGNLSLVYMDTMSSGESGVPIDGSVRTIFLMVKGIGLTIAIAVLLGIKAKNFRSAFLSSNSDSPTS